MTLLRAEWIDAIGREHVLEVARALGLQVQAPRGASGGSCSCPACGAERRHPSRRDPRLAIGVRAEGRGWRCYQCDASGDQLHLVALALEQRRWDELDGDRKARVRAWVIEWLRIGESPSSTPARPRLELPPPDAAPEYPPREEVAALWGARKSVLDDRRIAEWLHAGRGLPVKAIAACDLVGALPYGTECPAWAAKPQTETRPAVPWSKTAYRAIFPLFDATGAMRGLLARYVGTPSLPSVPKSRAAAGYSRRGLVLADGRGRELLEGRLARGDAAHRPLRVVIAEGEMDVLAFAVGGAARASVDAAGELVAVLGVVSGSWTPELAARIPDGSTVLIATHADRDGERYATAITKTLVDRMQSGAIRAERWRAR